MPLGNQRGFPPTDEVVGVDDVATAFADLVVAESPATIALSGGSTARRCYETLATRSGLDWARMTVLFGDERWVDVDHPDSNEGMARAELLDHVSPGTVHSLRGVAATPEEAAAAYDVIVRRVAPIDVVHLGLGPDGHTASLFAGSPALAETNRLVVAAEAGQPPMHPRLTLTLPGLARSRHVVFTVEGESKAEAWAHVVAGGDVPARRVRSSKVTWLVDRKLLLASPHG